MRVNTLDILSSTYTRKEDGRINSKCFVYQNNGMRVLFETFDPWGKTQEEAEAEAVEWIMKNRKNPKYQIIRH